MTATRDSEASPAVLDGRRRLLVGAAAALALPALHAQAQRGAPRRVGFLPSASQADMAPFLASLRDGLQALGWREGDNFVLDARYPDYSADGARGLAAAMAAEKPALIVANGGGIVP